MKIKLEPTESQHKHKFVVEFDGYFGDMDISRSGEQAYEVDSIHDSTIVEKLMTAFDAMSDMTNDTRGFPEIIPFWEDEDIFLYDVVPYNADYFDSYMRVSVYGIYYYDYSGNKFRVMKRG